MSVLFVFLRRIHKITFIVQNSEFTRKLGKLVVEMAEVQNCMSWLVPLMLCDLQVIQPCSTSSNGSTCYWVMETQCTPGFPSCGAGPYCWLSPYGLNFCWFSRILRLVGLLSTSDLETYSVFNMHHFELTKYSQEPHECQKGIFCVQSDLQMYAAWNVMGVSELEQHGLSIYLSTHYCLELMKSWHLITAVICYDGADSSDTFRSNSD